MALCNEVAVSATNSKRRLLPCMLHVLVLSVCLLSASAFAQSAPQSSFTGLWRGTIRVTPLPFRTTGRAGAVNNITLSIVQDGSQISGSYTCAIGTQICRNGNADDSGKIVSGRADGNNIQFSFVLPADVSNCDYSGVSLSPGEMRGGYTCYQGGGLIEQGMFNVSRDRG